MACDPKSDGTGNDGAGRERQWLSGNVRPEPEDLSPPAAPVGEGETIGSGLGAGADY